MKEGDIKFPHRNINGVNASPFGNGSSRLFGDIMDIILKLSKCQFSKAQKKNMRMWTVMIRKHQALAPKWQLPCLGDGDRQFKVIMTLTSDLATISPNVSIISADMTESIKCYLSLSIELRD